MDTRSRRRFGDRFHGILRPRGARGAFSLLGVRIGLRVAFELIWRHLQDCKVLDGIKF